MFTTRHVPLEMEFAKWLVVGLLAAMLAMFAGQRLAGAAVQHPDAVQADK